MSCADRFIRAVSSWIAPALFPHYGFDEKNTVFLVSATGVLQVTCVNM